VRRPLAWPDWFARARKPSVAASYFTWVVLQHGAPGEWGMRTELLVEVQERSRVLAAAREDARGVVKSMSAAASGMKETIVTNDFVYL
jgi:hypothetical protein